MEKGDKIYVAGHTGLVGNAVCRTLKAGDYRNIIVRTHKELDLINQNDVSEFFKLERPQHVVLAAGKVGGINACMTTPADFIYENLAMQTNVIHAAHESGVKKLLLLGISCAYPSKSPQPMKEEYLLTGYIEPSSESYAVAKIAGIKMCQAYNRQHGATFICAIPGSPYGPNDNFDPLASHVIPGLIVKFHKAKMDNSPAVSIWGTGSPLREFIYVDDFADAAIFLMNNYNESEIINVASGEEVSIGDLAHIVGNAVGYKGDICFDKSKPDGASRKLLDTTRMEKLGWRAKTGLETGIKKTYEWYLKNRT